MAGFRQLALLFIVFQLQIGFVLLRVFRLVFGRGEYGKAAGKSGGGRPEAGHSMGHADASHAAWAVGGPGGEQCCRGHGQAR